MKGRGGAHYYQGLSSRWLLSSPSYGLTGSGRVLLVGGGGWCEGGLASRVVSLSLKDARTGTVGRVLSVVASSWGGCVCVGGGGGGGGGQHRGIETRRS